MTDNIKKDCIKLLNEKLGVVIFNIHSLPGSGSARQYFRAETDRGPYVICHSANVKENDTFIKLSRMLKENGLPVPSIYAVSEDLQTYVLEDLGNTDLMSALVSHHESEKTWTAIKESIRQLVAFQTLPESEWVDVVEFPPLDSELINYDFRYAVTNLIDPYQVKYDRERLTGELKKLEEKLLSCPPELWGLMYRDFQSRNIMLTPKPFFIDYQSCRRGPGIYDLVSFAWQAKAEFTPVERDRIIEWYSEFMDEKGRGARTIIKETVVYWAMFRIIQTLGAYGLRGLKEGKRHFIESIPMALDNLKSLMETSGVTQTYPELYGIVLTISNEKI